MGIRHRRRCCLLVAALTFIDPKPLNGSLARALGGNEKAVVGLAANLAPTDLFLNGNVLRRDETKFVERDAQTGHSQHYALSDFGTSGAAGVRQGQDYMKNYFLDRYGAISDIDFSPPQTV